MIKDAILSAVLAIGGAIQIVVFNQRISEVIAYSLMSMFIVKVIGWQKETNRRLDKLEKEKNETKDQ